MPEIKFDESRYLRPGNCKMNRLGTTEVALLPGVILKGEYVGLSKPHMMPVLMALYSCKRRKTDMFMTSRLSENVSKMILATIQSNHRVPNHRQPSWLLQLDRSTLLKIVTRGIDVQTT